MYSEKNKPYPGLQKRGLFVLLLFLFFLLGFISGYFTRPYTPLKLKQVVRFVYSMSPSDIGVCLCRPDKKIKLQRSDGLKIVGSIYGGKDFRKHPGILLLHGNTPLGRKLPMYMVLADKLAERGYVVLSIDFTGFGESDDPFKLGTKEALKHDRDVNAALSYLLTFPGINRNQIYIIGHSGGAVRAFSVGIKDNNIKKIVAIAPPRRVNERFHDTKDINFFWKLAQHTRKEIYSKQFPPWYTKDFWLERVLESDMDQHIPYFSESSHKPLFLIDGEKEDKEDKSYLYNYYSFIVEPKKYLTIPLANHFFNTEGIIGINVYDKSVLNRLADEIDQWLKM